MLTYKYGNLDVYYYLETVLHICLRFHAVLVISKRSIHHFPRFLGKLKSNQQFLRVRPTTNCHIEITPHPMIEHQ